MATDQDNEALDLADLIRDLGHGATNRLATTRLREVLLACKQNPGTQGGIVLALAVKANPDGIVELKAKLTVKKPEPGLPGGAFFSTDEGDLVTQDPRQTNLPLPKALPKSNVIKLDNGGNAQ